MPQETKALPKETLEAIADPKFTGLTSADKIQVETPKERLKRKQGVKIWMENL